MRGGVGGRGLARDFELYVLFITVSNSVFDLNCKWSVSYTHLDVYKRQVVHPVS